MLSTFNSMTFAVLAPGYYQQLAQAEEEFTADLNVFAGHYPLDVVGGRILRTYVLAQTLAGNPRSRLWPAPGDLSRRRRTPRPELRLLDRACQRSALARVTPTLYAATRLPWREPTFNGRISPPPAWRRAAAKAGRLGVDHLCAPAVAWLVPGRR